MVPTKQNRLVGLRVRDGTAGRAGAGVPDAVARAGVHGAVSGPVELVLLAEATTQDLPWDERFEGRAATPTMVDHASHADTQTAKLSLPWPGDKPQDKQEKINNEPDNDDQDDADSLTDLSRRRARGSVEAATVGRGSLRLRAHDRKD